MLHGKIRIIFFFLFCITMLQIPFLLQNLNGSFRLSKIAIDLPFCPFWESDPPSPAVLSLFSQPFFYLGHGAQAYVFESQDGAYVLKLFRGSPKTHPWTCWVRRHILGKRDRKSVKEKIPPLFAACQLAYTKAPELTGLLYLHLNPTNDLLPTLHLVKRTQKKVSVDLNQCRFVLQKKGKPIADVFREVIKKGDRDGCIRLAQSVVSLLKERVSRNIGNLDKTLWYNFGFVGETAIEWDFGRYYTNPRFNDLFFREQEMRIFTNSLQTFLQENAPDWSIDLKAFF